MYDMVAVKVDHTWWVNSIASLTPLEGMESTDISVEFMDLIWEDPEFVQGPHEVGARVFVKEPPCPMDNCNGPQAHGVFGTVVALCDSMHPAEAVNPEMVKVWYYIQ